MTTKEEQYYSVKEFAEKVGLTKQAIYKRLSIDLKPFVEYENGQKVLNSKAFQLFSDSTSLQESLQYESLKKVVSLLERQLQLATDQAETLKAELAIKNEQIRDQSRQIAELSERLKESHLLIDHQQQLTAAGLLTAVQQPDPDEDESEAPTERLTPDMIPPQREKEEEPPRKWWPFGRRKKNV